MGRNGQKPSRIEFRRSNAPVARAMRAGSGMATRIAEGGFGITHREWGMIGMLAQVGEIRPSALAVQLQLDRVCASRGLRSLFEKRLIERRQDSKTAAKSMCG